MGRNSEEEESSKNELQRRSTSKTIDEMIFNIFINARTLCID